MTKKVAAYTLGCKVNSYDTEAMLSLFETAGYEVVDFDTYADILIINTCTVTNLGSKKSRQAIRKARNANPNAIVVATGCYSQVAPEEVSQIEGVNLVLGTKDRQRIVREVESYRLSEGVSCHIENIMDEHTFETLSVSKLDNHTRAFLKIQEGCQQFCAYCIIPYARGPVRSRPLSDTLAQVNTFAQNGFKEIVLAGIHVASYGNDLEGVDLLTLLEQAHAIDGIERIRFSSIEPTLIDANFIARIKNLPKICDHFHLSLQSGCDATLKRMHRKYSTSQYAQAVHLLRKAFPQVAITTDVIVGFPGETDAHFNESMAFIEKMTLSKLHVFPYSPKKGTPAAAFKDQIAPAVKQKRCKHMLQLGDRLNDAFIQSALGQTMSVLYEKQCAPSSYEGYTTNYIKVLTESADNMMNQVLPVTLKHFSNDTARGIIGPL